MRAKVKQIVPFMLSSPLSAQTVTLGDMVRFNHDSITIRAYEILMLARKNVRVTVGILSSTYV